MSFLGIQTGDRFDGDPDRLRTSGTFAEVRPAAYDPRQYIDENERDGVWGSVLYPSQGLVLYEVPVTDVVTAAMKAYNDWLADFCHEDAARLKGVAMINVDDIHDAVAELQRCRELGLAGALISVAPPAWQPYRSRDYDPFWAAAQDLEMPLSLHVATDRADPRVGAPAFRLDVKQVPPSVFVNPDAQVRHSLADLIFSGVFERFPGLQVGSVEHELGWIPFFLDRLDYTYTDRPPARAGVDAIRRSRHAPERLLPSQRLRVVPAGPERVASDRRARRGHSCVGERLSPHRVDVPAQPGDRGWAGCRAPAPRGGAGHGDELRAAVRVRRPGAHARVSADVDLAVRGGTVVDGTGRAGFLADVGISGGRIVSIGARVHGADEIDATGRLVVPGFVDVHTHYDAQALWDPDLSPSVWQGVTSVVAGNCGFSIAPVRETGRDLLLRTLETVEDMRLATMKAGIDWDFETYPEYLGAVARRKPTINFGGYVGHTAVRVYVMGPEASERRATDSEIDAMRAVVADALRGGALGFSTDRGGFIAGADGRPVPSMVASQGEVEALMRVTAEVGRGIVHVAPGDDYDWLYDFQPTLGRVVNWSSVLAYPEGSTTRASYRRKLADHAAGRRRGADVWAQVTCRPISQLVTLRDPAPFSSVPAFGEVLAATPDRRRGSTPTRPGGSAPSATWRRPRSRCGGTCSRLPRRRRSLSSSGSPWLRSRQRASRSPFATMCDLALNDDLATRFAITFANDDPDGDLRIARRRRLHHGPVRCGRPHQPDL